MTLMLGIDTGGTFTDAVLVDESTDEVVATAKAPTTHGNVAVGVTASMQAVVDAHQQASAAQIGLVSVSTTLATNALVEATGDPACLITLGFTDAELERAGVRSALEGNHHLPLPGGHNAHGAELHTLDLDDAAAQIVALAPQVSAFAIASQFSVRNPQHELALRDLVAEKTGLPVTCSHQLSARLDGPRRALTALLNARLVGMIDELARAVGDAMDALGIDAPLMMVRGDGTLVSAEFAAERPIETVLSGPAASVIGAQHLCDLGDALVVDMGGTTTDVAAVRDGQPAITRDGATVAGHRTMVEAVDMVTRGLGGDSEVRIDSRHPDGPLLLGPTRAIPMCRLAGQYPVEVHNFLDKDLLHTIGIGSHGRLLVSFVPADRPPAGLDEREQQVLAALTDGPVPVNEACPTGLLMNAGERLRRRGLVRVATMTPTDAAHVLGHQSSDDTDAANKAAQLLARQSDSTGRLMADSAEAFAQLVHQRVVNESVDLALTAALAADGIPATETASAITRAALARHTGLVRLDVGLHIPVVALGAPAPTYYPEVAQVLGTSAVLPQHGNVANAVGSVVGRVAIKRVAAVTQPSKGQYRLHHDDQPTFGSVDNAKARGVEVLSELAVADALRAGAASPEVTHVWEQTTAMVEGKEVFVEGTLTVQAAGRPRLA